MLPERGTKQQEDQLVLNVEWGLFFFNSWEVEPWVKVLAQVNSQGEGSALMTLEDEEPP